MSEVIVDARGRSCPEPVIMTRKALEKAKVERDQIIVYVDSQVAVENIGKLVKRYGYLLTTEKIGNEFELLIEREEE